MGIFHTEISILAVRKGCVLLSALSLITFCVLMHLWCIGSDIIIANYIATGEPAKESFQQSQFKTLVYCKTEQDKTSDVQVN